MASLLLDTNQTLSTSAGTWRTVEASNFAAWGSDAGQGRNDINTERTQAVTFANAGNQSGIMLWLSLVFPCTGVTTSQTVVIKLQELVASVWTTRTTDTFTLTTTAGLNHQSAIRYFPLTSYAVNTTAGIWRYAVQDTTASGKLYWNYLATGYGYAVTLGFSANKPTTGDIAYIANNVTLSMDENLNITGGKLFLCDDAIFQTLNPVTAPMTLTIGTGGSILLATSGRFIIGTQANPISNTNKFTLAMGTNGLIGVASYYLYSGNAVSQPGYPYQSSTIEFWGAENDNIQDTVSENAAALQKVFKTTRDMSAIWSNGDVLTFSAKKQTAGAADTATYTIASMSGTSITLNANLDLQVLQGGKVINYSERDSLGIWITGTNDGFMYGSHTWYERLVFQGVYMEGINQQSSGIYVRTNANTTQTSIFRDILENPTASQRGWWAFNEVYNLIVDNVVIYNIYGNNGTSSEFYVTAKGVNISITDYTSKDPYNNFGLTLVNCSNVTCTRVVIFANVLRPATGSCGLNVSKATFTDCYFYGTGNSIMLSGIAMSFLRCSFQGAQEYNIRVYGNSANLTFTDCSIGNIKNGTLGEIFTNAGVFSQMLFSSSEVYGTNTVVGISSNVDTSYVRFHELNSTVNTHVDYEKYGNISSTGDSLTDTTVHTSGTGKFAIRFEPIDTTLTNNLTWSFDVPTGNIQNKTMTVAVWCKINSATYYAGTNQLPRLTINYDNGTTAYCQAAQSTNWQQLFVTFVPTTTYGQITVTLSGRTDATTTNAYIYWDDFAILYPAGVTLDLGGMDNWANALPVTPPIALPISAYTISAAVWEELKTSHTTTGSMGKLVVDTEQKVDDNQALIISR